MLLAKAYYFLSAGSSVFLFPYLYPYFQYKGFTDAQLGVVSALRPWISAIAGVAFPVIADHLQCHKLLMLTTFCASVLLRLAMLYAVSNFLLLLSVLLLSEFLASPVGVLADAMVVAASEKSGGYGRQRLWASIGWGGLSYAGGVLLDQYGFEAGFVMYGILSLPCILVLMRFGDLHGLVKSKEKRSLPASQPTLSREDEYARLLGAPCSAEKCVPPHVNADCLGTVPLSDAATVPQHCAHREGSTCCGGEGGVTDSQDYQTPARAVDCKSSTPAVLNSFSFPRMNVAMGNDTPMLKEYPGFFRNALASLLNSSGKMSSPDTDCLLARDLNLSDVSEPDQPKLVNGSMQRVLHLHVSADGTSYPNSPVSPESSSQVIKPANSPFGTVTIILHRLTTSIAGSSLESLYEKSPQSQDPEQKGSGARIGKGIRPTSFARETIQLLRSGSVWLFLAKSILLGFGAGAMGTWLLIYMSTLGASHALQGLMLTVNCIAEVPAFHFQSAISSRFSTTSILHVSIGTLVFRLLAYAMLPSLPGAPWIVLPVELLHGITFAVFWGAACVHCKELAPGNLQATMQGLMQSVYNGVGAGLGGLIGAVLHDQFGGRLMFLITSMIIFAGWILLTAVEVFNMATNRRLSYRC